MRKGDKSRMKNNLAAPCGLYYGSCRQYLARSKKLLEEKGLKRRCGGCRIRNNKCAFIRRDCEKLRKNKLEFCYECDKIPCQKLKKLNKNYTERWNVDLIENLKRIKKVGTEKWLKEQEKLYICPKCQGNICIHDTECYNCGNIINPNL